MHTHFLKVESLVMTPFCWPLLLPVSSHCQNMSPPMLL